MHALIAAGRVVNVAVYTPDGRRIGRVAEVAVDDATGEVAFVLLAEGGILGFGETLRRLAWSVLSYRPELRGYVLEAAGARREEILDLSGMVAFQRSADRGGWASGG